MLEYVGSFLASILATISPVQWVAAVAVGLAVGALAGLREGRHG